MNAHLNRLDPRRRARSGMVLFEVMLAMAVFTMVAFSLIVALDSAFDAAQARNRIDAAMVGLENQAALLHQSRLVTGEQTAPDDGSGIIYKLDVEPEQMRDQKGNQVGNEYRATIKAQWTLNGQEQERSLSELIYQP